MMTKLFNQAGEVIGEVALPDRVFGLRIKPNLIHQVFVAQMANSRQVLAHAKGRGEVRGGGRKPWRQKGTGRARHASIRSPIWRGGGVTFGPTKERNFSQKINKRAKRQAMFMTLSTKVRDKEFLLLDDFKLENWKTREAAKVLKTIVQKLDGYRANRKKADSILLVTADQGKMVKRAVGNIPFVQVLPAGNLNVKDLLERKYLIMLKDAIGTVEKTFKA